jgi:hypothetical protein
LQPVCCKGCLQSLQSVWGGPGGRDHAGRGHGRLQVPEHRAAQRRNEGGL